MEQNQFYWNERGFKLKPKHWEHKSNQSLTCTCWQKALNSTFCSGKWCRQLPVKRVHVPSQLIRRAGDVQDSQLYNWQLKCKHTGCSETFPGTSRRLVVSRVQLERGGIWVIQFVFVFLLSSFIPPPPHTLSESAGCLHGDQAVTLPTRRHHPSSGGAPASVDTHTPTNQSPMNRVQQMYSPQPGQLTVKFRCSEIADDLRGRGTLAEYSCGGQGQRRNTGARQPSLL